MIGSRLTWALGSLALFAVALHCGSTGGSAFTDVGSGGPCETVYKGLCGKECAADTECADGLHCGPDKTCTADCSPDHECSTGSCSARGRCESGGGGFGDSGSIDGSLPDGGVCADTNVTLTKILPKVVFLLDQSSSMWNQAFPSGSANNCNGGCRWTVLKDVLIGPNDKKGGLLKQLDGEAEIAIELYSATDGSQDGDDSYLDPPTTAVCPRFNGKAFDGLTFSATSYAGAEALLRNAKVDDDTPTGPAIRAVVGLAADGGVGDSKGFAALESTAPKVLVLVTDGEPGTCVNSQHSTSSPSDPGRAQVITAVQQTFKHNIRTFVIAVGSQGAAEHFNAVANAGQGKDPATGDAGAILPSNQQQLVDALEQIVKDARTCTFDLNGSVEAGKEGLGTVTLNGNPVPFDPVDGWRLNNPSQLELVGSACKTLKSSSDAQLSAKFPCGTVIPRVPK